MLNLRTLKCRIALSLRNFVNWNCLQILLLLRTFTFGRHDTRCFFHLLRSVPSPRSIWNVVISTAEVSSKLWALSWPQRSNLQLLRIRGRLHFSRVRLALEKLLIYNYFMRSCRASKPECYENHYNLICRLLRVLNFIKISVFIFAKR